MTRNPLRNSCRDGVLAGLLIVALLTLGCQKKESPPASPPPVKAAVTQVKPVQKPLQKQLSSAIKPSPATINQFDFSSKKDPFKPFVVVKAGPVATAENSKKAALPIHSFDVSQFRLIGVVTGGKAGKAMVVDPNGKGYVLKVGMTVGKNDGRVTEISINGVEILEQFKDDSGRVRRERFKITLPRKQ